jgi:ubiquinone/menaquinone biosynthesis C-methylase UbiE
VTTSEGPLTEPFAWNLVAPNYAEDVVPQFSPYAADALRLAAVTKGERVLDVACGPGTLAFLAARGGAKVTAIDFAEEMIHRLKDRAQRDGVAIDARVGDGMALDVGDSSFDAAFSMFGLMFFADRMRGYRELLRALAPGGRAVVASWRAFDKVPIITEMFAALAAELPWAPFGKPGSAPPLTDGEDLAREMREAGFADVVLHAITHTSHAASTRAYWTYVQRTMAPLLLLQQKVGAEEWARIDAAVYQRVAEKLGDGAIMLPFTANVAIGQR